MYDMGMRSSSWGELHRQDRQQRFNRMAPSFYRVAHFIRKSTSPTGKLVSLAFATIPQGPESVLPARPMAGHRGHRWRSRLLGCRLRFATGPDPGAILRPALPSCFAGGRRRVNFARFIIHWFRPSTNGPASTRGIGSVCYHLFFYSRLLRALTSTSVAQRTHSDEKLNA